MTDDQGLSYYNQDGYGQINPEHMEYYGVQSSDLAQTSK